MAKDKVKSDKSSAIKGPKADYNKIDLRKGLNDINFKNRETLQIISSGRLNEKYGTSGKRKRSPTTLKGLKGFKDTL